jgi:glycosyltransferase involved in cell wall biosynthesis
MQPLVSICCVTYNHADTIAQALDSFLWQRGDMEIEILVHDDASTDGTEAILRRYEALYPEVVKPLYETENQYKKGLAMDATFNFPRARGKYIALCEGDDYFSDPHKLRLQVEAMEARPHCTFCFTNGTVRDMAAGGAERPFIPYYPQEAAFYAPQTRELDVEGVARLTFIPTASFLFPRDVLARVPREALTMPCPSGDLRLKLLLTAAGRALYVHAFTCVYRLNAGSSTMARWGAEAAARTAERCGQVIGMLRAVDAFSAGRWHTALQTLVDAQYRVMLLAAPTPALLRAPEAKAAWRALTPAQRLKTRLKARLPQKLFRRLKALVARG